MKKIGDILGLTPLQAGMLFHYLEAPTSTDYNEQLSLEISGKIDLEIFRKAWNEVIKTNEMLRVIFRWEKMDNPVQIILKSYELQPKYYDLLHENTEEKKIYLENIRTNDRESRFGLQEVPFRVILCRIEKDKYEMIISYHHILYDGWSNGIVLKEFFKIYHELSNDRKAVRLPLKPPFKEFIKWIQGQDKKKQSQYWIEYLAGIETATELPIKRRVQKTAKSVDYSIILGRNLKTELDIFVRNYRLTLASVFYTVWGILLQKYCDSEDVIFGTTVSGRPAEIKGIEDMVGLFINSIPLRIQSVAGIKIIDILSGVENTLQAREEFQSTPLPDIKKYSNVIGTESLFDTVVAIENYPLDNRLLPAGSLLSIHSYSIVEMTHYDLAVGITLFNEIEIKFSYNPSIYDKKAVENLAVHFIGIIQKTIDNPETVLSQLEIISHEEKNRLLYEFNNTAVEYPIEKTIHQLFIEQAEQTPDRIAVLGRGQTRTNLHNKMFMAVTYRELNEQSNRLACVLQTKGVNFGSIAGIMIERSIEMIFGLLGILKSGAAYLPIDPHSPGERVEFMLHDSAAAILLTENELSGCLLNNRCGSGSMLPAGDPQSSTFLAYVIYTSGSTGRPKGVLIKHKGFVNLIYYHHGIFEENPDSRMSQVANPAFDAMGFEIWPCLSSGAALHIADEDIRSSPPLMRDWLISRGITISFQPTVMAEALLAEPWPAEGVALKSLCTAGDKLNRYPERAYPFRLYNLYGPTEDTVWTTWTEVKTKTGAETSPGIGKPIANHHVYILNSDLNFQPAGVPGELCIGGCGLAEGYLNNPELTAERFIYFTCRSPLIIYKTGDRARFLSNGNIEFLGRIDHQIKIRGFRVELGEIESRLSNLPGMKEAVVLAHEDKNNDKYICAYIVSVREYTMPELRESLSKGLPDYMIPSYIVHLEKIPLTANGKVDRRALPEPKLKAGESYVGPRNEIERKLVKIWNDVLTRPHDESGDEIGIDDNFFQLGGHSLKATSLASRIYKDFDVKIPVGEIFKKPTIRELFDYINGATSDRYARIEVAEKKEYYMLSSAQKRLYFLQQMDNAGTAYNISAAWVLEGIIDKTKLEQTFARLIQRHDSFRTSFGFIGEEPVQIIHDNVKFEIEYKDLTIENIEDRKHQSSFIINHSSRPFDLSKAPLLWVGLEKTEEERHSLAVDMHHIISDGISAEILVRDFTDIYSGEELPVVSLQYKDYAEWQNRLKTSENFLMQEEYWNKEFGEEIPVLELPTDYSRPAIQDFEGNRLSFEISRETVESLNSFALETGTTLYMVLLASYSIFLSKVCGQEDIIIGTPVAGRRYADLEKIIGVFVNTLALRIRPAGEKMFIDFLAEVKKKTLEAFENQDYQYEDLVELAAVSRDTSRNPLFDTMLVLQNMGASEIDIPGLKLVPDEFENKTSKFDLTLTGVEIDGELVFTFEYCTKLFKRGTIERFITYFKNIITGLPEDSRRNISDLEIITSEEKNRVLYEFNRTAAGYPENKTIHELFEEQVERTPFNIAVIGSSIQITYGELNENSNRLAHVLREKGVEPDTIVGIKTERSADMITGLFGILKAGGAYMPIDSDYPNERIRYMLKDSGTKVLITTGNLAKVDEAMGSWEGEKVLLNEIPNFPENTTHHPISIPSNSQSPSNLIYIIYTSGTTGRPKGSLIEHRNVVRLMLNDKFQFDFTDNDVWTMFHSYCFDFSVWEMYGALLYGGKLIIVPKVIARDTAAFLGLLNREAVTVLNQTPSAFYNLIDESLNPHGQVKNSSLKYVIFGGEALNPLKLKGWQDHFPQTRLVNMFGITETTVHVTYKEITKNEIELNISNIGTPIPTLNTYLLNRYLKPVPVGVIGEICVGGDGVCRGYLNRVELTEEKFLENPFLSGGRLYRSGDIGRFRENGEMEYLGRIDHQVKIRGFRIELGEIESQLLKHKEIKEAVVLAEEMPDEKYLCAFIVSYKHLTITELREYLSGKLPDYMIPSYFVQLERIPLTANGKIDRKALPGVHGNDDLMDESTSPITETEEKLVELWESVLGIKPGINVDFFHSGGDSIKAVRLVNSINMKLSTNLKIPDIYLNGTIKKLASVIDRDRMVYRYTNEELSRALAEIEKLRNIVMSDPRSPEDIEDVYPMSDIQKGMVFHSLKDKASALYHDQMVYQPVIKDFNPKIFRKAFILLVEKHSILRTVFDLDTYEESVQLVYQSVPGDIEHYDISYMGKDEQEDHLLRFLAEDRRKNFQFDVPPLWRLRTFDLGDDRICVVLVAHHAILDGWSVASLVTELINTYWRLKSNPAFVPGILKNSYKVFVIEQTIEKKRSDSTDFWKSELDGFKRMELSSLAPKSGSGNIVKKYRRKPGNDLLSKLKEAAKTHHSCIKNLCFSAFIYMLNIFSYENEIVVGLVSNNRPVCEDGDKILGCFLNTIPVRMKIPSYISGLDFVTRVETKLLELKKYERMPLFDIARIGGEDAYDRNPIFDVMFNFVDFHVLDQIEQDYGKNVTGKLGVEENVKTNILFSFGVSVTLGDLDFIISYADAIFDEETVENLYSYFERVLTKIIDEPGSRIKKVELIPVEEKKKLLIEFNNTGAEVSFEKTIQQLLLEQVMKTPDYVAVVGPGIIPSHELFFQISYRELNEISYRVSCQLKQRGVQPGNIVGIMVGPSIEMITGILSIIKSGGAYLPLDPNQPAERRNYMLFDSTAALLLTTDRLIETVGFNGPIAYFDEAGINKKTGGDLNEIGNPGHILYSIYTSGTTGKSKGALIENRNLANYVHWFRSKVHLTIADRTILTSSFGFDLGYTAIFPAILSGCQLHIVLRETYLSSEEMMHYIYQHRISYIKITPSLLRALVESSEFSSESLASLRMIVLGGEPIKIKDVEKSFSLGNHLQIMNHYGPTEATIGCVAQLIDADSFDQYKAQPTIGYPIDNMKIFILDNELNLLPLGIPGELCVCGSGVARGYLNRPELTNEKFAKLPTMGIERMYRTGDVARWTRKGVIEFLGRLDLQVKIRGFRIELGEIEEQLLKHKDIKEALVMIREDSTGDKILAAYLVPGKEFSDSELRSYLLINLPEYMIPSYFVWINNIPLTHNGKIDRKALPAPVLNVENEFGSPRSDVEKKLVEIWSAVLGIEKEKIGIDSNFFKMGGHSLKATIIAAKIHKLFNLKISLADMFRNPTIMGLAGMIKELKEDRFESIAPAEKKEYYSLSYAQKRIFTAHQLEAGSTSYNMAIILQLIGEVDRERLQQTFRKLIERHESLRTTFEIIGNEPVQRVHPKVEFAVECHDFEEEVAALRNYIQPFDLTQAPLLRVYLSKTGDRNYFMLMDTSHLISDGVSSMLIARDLLALYSTQELPPLNIQYKDFSEWENRLYQSGNIKKQEDFWLNVFRDEFPVLELPIDFPRPDVRYVESGDMVSFNLKESTKQKLYKMIGETDCTLFTILLAVYYVLLNKYSGQEDIVIGGVVTGRTHEDLENVMGVFINILPLRNRLQPGESFRNFLSEIKEKASYAFENQDYSMEELIKKLKIRKKPGRYPLFDVVFNLNNIEKTKMEQADFEIKPYRENQDFAKFDLTLYAVEGLESIDLYLRYSTQLFKRTTIEKLMQYYIEIIEQIVENMDIRIQDIKVSHRRVKTKSKTRQFSTDDFVFA